MPLMEHVKCLMIKGSQPPHSLWFHLNEVSKIGKSIETENAISAGCLGLGRGGKWEVTPNEFAIAMMKML